jgi:hypothetical protein
VGKCPFYQIEMHRNSAGPADALLTPCPWCSHLSSPVSMLLATEAVGEVAKLNCGGNLARCELPSELRPPYWLTG